MPSERRPIPDGYFTATIPDEMLKQLIDILKISEIDKLPATGIRNIDIPDHTIEIYYNHKIKHIYAGSLPVAADPLLRYLEGLPKKLTLVPSADSFEIQFAEQN